MVPTACAAKIKEVGVIFMAGAGEVPMPVKETDCIAPGTFPELSVKFRLALNVPGAEGAKDN